MSAPLIFNGRRAKMLTQDGILRADGSIIDNNGTPNLIKNGHAEINVTGWTVSKNTVAASRPDSGFVTSSTNITWTRNTTNPIDGQADFLYTKDAANRQGEQVYCGFTVSKKYRAKVLQIEVDYLVNSGTFSAGSSSTDSDIIVYIYDVTNSTFIEPSSFKFLSNSSTIADKFIANFQTSATGSSYRILFHQATTSSSAFAVQFKEVRVSPCNYVYGTLISDWVSYTPTGTFTTNSTYTGLWRRVGDTLESQVKIAFAGAPNSTSLTLNIPTGMTIDTNKTVSTNSDNLIFGSGTILDAGTKGYPVNIDYGSSTSLRVIVQGADQTILYNSGYVTQALPFTIGSGDSLAVTYRVPITGWSSSTQVSDGYDGRQIVSKANGSQSLSNNSETTADLTASEIDKTASIDLSANTITVKSAGLYRITGKASVGAPAGVTFNGYLNLRKNGSTYETLDVRTFTTTGFSGTVYLSGSTILEAVAGDSYDLRVFQQNGSSASATTNTVFIVEKLQAPTTMSATEVVAATYNSSATSISSSAATIIYTSKDIDTHGAYNTSTGKFTCPVAGLYEVNAGIFATSTFTSQQASVIGVRKNSTDMYEVVQRHAASESNQVYQITSPPINCLAGDTLEIRFLLEGTSPSIVTSSVRNYVGFKRIK